MRKAANSGHLGAMYVTGITLIIHGGEEKEKGMKIIIDMRKSETTRKKMKEVREKFSSKIRSRWTKNRMVAGRRRPICCTRHEELTSTYHGWEEFGDTECEACNCDQEILNLWENIVPGLIHASS